MKPLDLDLDVNDDSLRREAVGGADLRPRRREGPGPRSMPGRLALCARPGRLTGTSGRERPTDDDEEFRDWVESDLQPFGWRPCLRNAVGQSEAEPRKPCRAVWLASEYQEEIEADLLSCYYGLDYIDWFRPGRNPGWREAPRPPPITCLRRAR